MTLSENKEKLVYIYFVFFCFRNNLNQLEKTSTHQRNQIQKESKSMSLQDDQNKYLSYNKNTDVKNEMLPLPSFAKEKNEFECLYLLVEAAVAVQNLEKEKSKVVA